ncbi:MAG: hypothetical protein AB7H92_17280 [Microbacteriaceae bacterium]
MVERGLLAHVVAKYAPSQWENIATETLLYVLERLGPSALNPLLAPLSISVTDGRWSSQVSAGDESGRPDLVCFDTVGRPVVMVEAKFWAELTKNQPTTYLARQATTFGDSEEPRALLFIAPASRVDSLLVQLRALVPGEMLDVEQPRLTVLRVGGDTVAVADWPEVLAVLEKTEDVEALEALAQLRGMCVEADRFPLVPFSVDDIDVTHARRAMNYGELVHRLVDRLKRDGIVDVLKAESNTRNSTGRLVRASETGHWFYVLFSTYRWATTYATPLWLSFPKPTVQLHNALLQLEPARSPRVKAEKDRVLVGLSLPLGVERAEAIRDLTRQIQLIVNGLPRADGLGEPLDADQD